MPLVTLISYTGHGHPDPLYAAKLLAFTKNTRLNMVPGGLIKFMQQTDDRAIHEELSYMAGTIPSSWEFVDLIFLLNEVSRSTAQQITRTRNASFAMQSMRVTDMRDVTWDNPDTTPELAHLFHHQMELSVSAYKHLVDFGMSKEDARDVLPLGVHCNIVAKYNLRAWVELVTKRQSLRVQGPYRDIVAQMITAVMEVWPWVAVFLEHPQEKALRMLTEVVDKMTPMGGPPQGDAAVISKAIDLLKKPD